MRLWITGGGGAMASGKLSASGSLCALLSIVGVLALVFVVPQIYVRWGGEKRDENRGGLGNFKLGFENIAHDFLQALTPRGSLPYNVALVTNRLKVGRVGTRNIDILLQKGLDVKKVFVPQGCHGSTQAPFPLDAVTRVPIINFQDRRLTIDDFKDVDVIFCDLQDTGVRHSSSLATLVNIMEHAAKLDKTIVVLDRPNPLGDAVEGAFGVTELSQPFFSAILPVRYGMTIGELSQYCNKHILKKSAALYVVPMDNYNRHRYWQASFIGALSNNIRSLESCHGYSFLGLLGEVAPFDVGLGTDKAFQCILLPEKVAFSKKQWLKLKTELKALGIESAHYRYFSHRKKQFCRGLRLSIADIGNFSLFKALISTLKFFKREGVALTFCEGFSKMPGMNKIKEIVEGSMKEEDLEAEFKCALERFCTLASSSFIYKPYPKPVVV